MARPKLCRRVDFNPRITYFKPQGVPFKELDVVDLKIEELEAYRLRYLENMDQQKAAKKMNISTSTYQRVISSAYLKIADGLINAKAIQIIK